MNIHRYTTVHVIAALLSAATVHAAGTASSTPPASTASLHGVVVDGATGQPIPSAMVRLRESGRSELSHADGSFHFDGIRAGTHTVTVERIGYIPLERTVSVTDDQIARLDLALAPSALQLPAVIVTGAGSERAAGSSYRSVSVLSDAELRRRLGGSLAATLASEPGLSQRYNGPAAAQPVVRGLSGDRVLVLEDGRRTGDIAATSGDHAVTVEPLTAERIEVVRGPAGVQYGSNSLGGVINVIREEVPRTVPEGMTGMLTAQVESVNRGMTAGGTVARAVGPVTMRAELSGRTAGDTRTPDGMLHGTGLDGYNAGAGLSRVFQRGHVGVAVRDYGLTYGVPGEFQEMTIQGSHEHGVEIDLRRTMLRAEGRLLGAGEHLSSIEADISMVRFDQRELELEEDHDDHDHDHDAVVGTHFRQYSADGSVRAHHRHETGSMQLEGAVGIAGTYRDLGVSGTSTGSLPAKHYSMALFAFEEFGIDPFRIEVGARYDWTRIDPLDTGSIVEARRRHFQSVSGSVAALYRPAGTWTTGISVSRSFRTPSIEDLFSNGPHLANYSFDIGNPDLDPEYGLGLDVFVRASLPAVHAEVGVFRNAISDYIYQAPTGELDPRLAQYPVYRAEQGDVVMHGVEGTVQWEVTDGWVIDGNASYVRGRLVRGAGDRDLPAIPPAHGALNIRRDGVRLFAGVGIEGAIAQNDISEFETQTAAYSLVNGTAGLRWTAFGRLNTLTLQARNIFDTAWRDHLSRIRSVAPQPGRNLQVLYRLDI